MYKNSKAPAENARRKSQAVQQKALRASMIAIEEESKRLAKGKLLSNKMVKGAKLSVVDVKMQDFIKKNLKGVIGHLGNITGAIVNRGEELGMKVKMGGGVADILAQVKKFDNKKFDDNAERKRLRAHSVSPPSMQRQQPDQSSADEYRGSTDN